MGWYSNEIVSDIYNKMCNSGINEYYEYINSDQFPGIMYVKICELGNGLMIDFNKNPLQSYVSFADINGDNVRTYTKYDGLGNEYCLPFLTLANDNDNLYGCNIQMKQIMDNEDCKFMRAIPADCKRLILNHNSEDNPIIFKFHLKNIAR